MLKSYTKLHNGEIYIHPFADKGDLKKNVDYGKVVVKNHSGKLEIIPDSGISGDKNPEYRYNGVVGDRTEWNYKKSTLNNYIENTFAKRKKQLKNEKEYGLALDLAEQLTQEGVEVLYRRLKGKFNISENLKWVLVKNGEKTILINNENINKTTFKQDIAKELLPK